MDGTREITVILEGAHGTPAPLGAYDTVLLLAGGSGISSVLGYLRSSCADIAAGKTRTRHVHLVWAVRQPAFARAVLGADIRRAVAFAGDGLEVDVYVTGDVLSKAMEGKEESLWEEAQVANAVVHTGGRPDMDPIIRAATAGARGRELAVLACGPAQLLDDARRSAVGVVADGHAGLGYFEESFGW